MYVMTTGSTGLGLAHVAVSGVACQMYPRLTSTMVVSVVEASNDTELPEVQPPARELGVALAAKDEERSEERALCERAQGGDRKALAELLRKHGPKLYRNVLLPRLGSDAAAQDALADTYVRVMERFHQFEWRGCGVYPWLRVVAMRIALDALRARKRETLFEPDSLARAVDAAERDCAEGIDEQLCHKRDRAEARGQLDEALSRINERYATAIRLRILEERSREEAAAELGVSVPTFDVVLHRALTALKKKIRVQRTEE